MSGKGPVCLSLFLSWGERADFPESQDTESLCEKVPFVEHIPRRTPGERLVCWLLGLMVNWEANRSVVWGSNDEA